MVGLNSAEYIFGESGVLRGSKRETWNLVRQLETTNVEETLIEQYDRSRGYELVLHYKYKYGISEMRTIVNSDGIIWTSYPTRGTSVIRIK